MIAKYEWDRDPEYDARVHRDDAMWRQGAEFESTRWRTELERLVKEWRTEQPKSIWSVTYLERGRCADELEAVLRRTVEEGESHLVPREKWLRREAVIEAARDLANLIRYNGTLDDVNRAEDESVGEPFRYKELR